MENKVETELRRLKKKINRMQRHELIHYIERTSRFIATLKRGRGREDQQDDLEMTLAYAKCCLSKKTKHEMKGRDDDTSGIATQRYGDRDSGT